METPYSYLQVDLQEHPTPIEFPPPFSIEEFNLSELSPASTGHEEPGKNIVMKQLIRAKHTLQQRIKRQNETPEQKALRRQRNAELNRKRRQNKEDIRVTIEKTKNRLRQRIKREIDRMLRTRQKRDDFLRETFEQMATVFSETDMMQFQERVATVIGEISN
uniref:Uncharacterized protein n=1 Tax=Anopheles atroparvus TaxID=41427 RepID=A0A182J733_ANOAO